MESLNRFDRIVAILIQLQTRRIIKAGDLAERFQVSLRTIYRDIRTLENAGVPIASEAGVGYSIMDGYRLPPVTFTREEAGSFIAAEKLMEQLTDKSLGLYHKSAMFKIKSVLRGREKDWISRLESTIRVDPAQTLFNERIPDALEIIMESIAERKQVSIVYHAVSSEEPSERFIDPVTLFHENNFWYVFGYCHLRNDYRQFRTNRLQEIRRTDKPFIHDHPTLEVYRENAQTREMLTVRILVDRKIARYIRSGKEYYGFISERVIGDSVEMTFKTADIENGFVRWYMMFGDYAQIIEPDRLRDRVRELLERTAARL